MDWKKLPNAGKLKKSSRNVANDPIAQPVLFYNRKENSRL